MNAKQQWQNVKEGYLKQIEKELAKIDHPKRAEILSSVGEHLDQKYAQLQDRQRNWEGYQQIITEMGPPEDYAELLTEQRPAPQPARFGVNELLAIVFVVTLIAIGVYLVFTAKETSSRLGGTPLAYTFETDERLPGTWTTVDFVKTIDDFTPDQKRWQDDPFLLEMQFKKDGTYHAKDKDKEYSGVWTKGKVNPDLRRPAAYEICNIGGKDYLFYEWISGDVTIRGMKPWYYVLVKQE
ncbi:MAG: hypothetical protein LLF76_14565 [Planctomycetaceae bacterium]|nr:hypothetical protein [Planctomycetaceae bacterium]